MKIYFAIAIGFIVVGIIGCGGPSAKSAEKLDHDNYSKTPAGQQAIRSGDGTSTSVNKGVDIASLGLAVFPDAELPREGEVYESQSPNAKQTTYILTTKKPMKEALAFYEKELNTKPSVQHGEVAIIMGSVKDGVGAVVTIDGKAAGATEIKVQISQKP